MKDLPRCVLIEHASNREKFQLFQHSLTKPRMLEMLRETRLYEFIKAMRRKLIILRITLRFSGLI